MAWHGRPGVLAEQTAVRAHPSEPPRSISCTYFMKDLFLVQVRKRVGTLTRQLEPHGPIEKLRRIGGGGGGTGVGALFGRPPVRMRIVMPQYALALLVVVHVGDV